jgi:hypothetical protein
MNAQTIVCKYSLISLHPHPTLQCYREDSMKCNLKQERDITKLLKFCVVPTVE